MTTPEPVTAHVPELVAIGDTVTVDGKACKVTEINLSRQHHPVLTPVTDEDDECDGWDREDPDGYDRNGVVAANGLVYSDADPGL